MLGPLDELGGLVEEPEQGWPLMGLEQRDREPPAPDYEVTGDAARPRTGEQLRRE